VSEVLRARMRECLTAYQVGCGTLLDVDELAAELLESVLPGLRRHRRRPHRLTRMPGVRVSRPGERHELWWTAQ